MKTKEKLQSIDMFLKLARKFYAEKYTESDPINKRYWDQCKLRAAKIIYGI